MIRKNLAVVGLVALTLAVALYVPTASAQSVVDTAHDLSTSSASGGATTNVDRVCVFCHTPHQAAAASAQDPLWNHTMSATSQTYGVYASATLNASPAEIGNYTAGSAATSNLCMSCHDGTVAVHNLYNAPNEVASVTITAGGNVNATGFITGTPLVGTNLTDDHPINFTYDNALYTADGGATGGLNDPAGAAVQALLVGGEVQCSSCHDPHDDTNSPFMTMDNTGSALCLTCHNK